MRSVITIILAFGQVVGAELVCAGVIFCVLLFAGAFALFRQNRSRRNMTRYLASAFAILELCDLIWMAYFFPGGTYVNRGLAGAGILFMFPLLLLMLNIILTCSNRR